MTCKDCAHKRICFRAIHMTETETDAFVADDEVNGCAHFLTMLCKPGDTVYSVVDKDKDDYEGGDTSPYRIDSDEVAAIGVDREGNFFVIPEYSNQSAIVGKEVFVTEQEAQEALKVAETNWLMLRKKEII